MHSGYKSFFIIFTFIFTASATAAPPAGKNIRQTVDENTAIIDELLQTVSALQAQVAALEAAANASLEDRVAGRTYAVRTTGHGISGNPDEAFVPYASFVRSLQNPFRDFSVSSGTLLLRDDNTFTLQSELKVIGTQAGLDGGDVVGRYSVLTFPLNGDGVWWVDEATGEIFLSSGQRLQASPSGELLTTVGNDIRLVEGFEDTPENYHSFIADVVYIQLPE